MKESLVYFKLMESVLFLHQRERTKQSRSSHVAVCSSSSTLHKILPYQKTPLSFRLQPTFPFLINIASFMPLSLLSRARSAIAWVSILLRGAWTV